MSYHDLSDSGMSDRNRRDEATRICRMLGDTVMKPHEVKFVADITSPYKTVSTKQLFYLRDLKDKYQ